MVYDGESHKWMMTGGGRISGNHHVINPMINHRKPEYAETSEMMMMMMMMNHN